MRYTDAGQNKFSLRCCENLYGGVTEPRKSVEGCDAPKISSRRQRRRARVIFFNDADFTPPRVTPVTDHHHRSTPVSRHPRLREARRRAAIAMAVVVGAPYAQVLDLM